MAIEGWVTVRAEAAPGRPAPEAEATLARPLVAAAAQAPGAGVAPVTSRAVVARVVLEDVAEVAPVVVPERQIGLGSAATAAAKREVGPRTPTVLRKAASEVPPVVARPGGQAEVARLNAVEGGSETIPVPGDARVQEGVLVGEAEGVVTAVEQVLEAEAESPGG